MVNDIAQNDITDPVPSDFRETLQVANRLQTPWWNRSIIVYAASRHHVETASSMVHLGSSLCQ
jgi:hypothetical protein